MNNAFGVHLQKFALGGPIGLASAALAFAGVHWFLVAALAFVSLILCSNALVETWNSGSVLNMAVSIAFVAIPFVAGGAAFVTQDENAAQVTQGLLGRGTLDGVKPSSGSSAAGERMIPFEEVAMLVRRGKAAEDLAMHTPDDRFAINSLKAWRAVGVQIVDQVDPRSGRPTLPQTRREKILQAKRTFEAKLARHGRTSLLTHEEAAWAAHAIESRRF